MFSICLLSSLTVCEPSTYGLMRCISVTSRSMPSYSCLIDCFCCTISSRASNIFCSNSSFSLLMYFISVSFSLIIQLQPSRSCLSLSNYARCRATTTLTWASSSDWASCSLKRKGKVRMICLCAMSTHFGHMPALRRLCSLRSDVTSGDSKLASKRLSAARFDY